MAACISNRRLSKELMDIQRESCPVGISLIDAPDLAKWLFSIEVLGESVYMGETFTLMFTFDRLYPIVPPIVQFEVTGENRAPIHPHIYSNGHICASILGSDWTPVLTVIAVCLTIQSMLASCKKKERPEDDDRYVEIASDNPKNTHFVYHDDNV